MVKGNRIIGLAVVLLMASGAVAAKGKGKPVQHELTQEEQMRLDYYLYAAMDASERNEHPRAFFLLELCNTIDSLNPTVCSMRGAYVQSLYGKEQALPLLRRAYEGSPSDYWYRYAVTAYELGKHKEAMEVIETMEKREPKNMDILELHEHILHHEQKYKQALAIRDKIDKLTGEPTVYSVLTRFELLNESGARNKALQVLDNYLERNPNDGRMRATRTDIRLQEAREHNNRQAGDSLLYELLHSADLTLGNKLKKLNTYKEWMEYDADREKAILTDLREQYPYEQGSYQALLDFEKGQGDISAALEIGKTMLTMNPTDGKLREQIADLMRDDPNVTLEEVGAFIDESYTLQPDDPKWCYFKALRCWQHQDPDSTILILKHALHHTKDRLMYIEILILYGDAQGYMKNYEEAFSAYDQVLEVAPKHLGVLNNYAWTLAISGGDLNKAESMSQMTILQESNNPTYLDTYAWILHLRGQETLALFYIKRAVENASKEDTTIQEHYQTILQATQQ